MSEDPHLRELDPKRIHMGIRYSSLTGSHKEIVKIPFDGGLLLDEVSTFESSWLALNEDQLLL